jgi:putative phosphoesterase
VRLAIVSDTHMPRGARRLPDACVDQCRDADAILHCGDFMRLEVVDQFESFGPPLYAVYGNVDDHPVRHRLPATQTVELGGKRFGMVHDSGPTTGRTQRLRKAFPDADAVLFGHSHMPAHDADGGGFQIFNPGSPTERRRAPAHTMGVATIEGDRLTFELVVVA